MPDTAWPISRHPPGSIPGWAGHPVSMPSIAVFDTSSVDRSRSPSWPTPDALTARLTPRTLTTTALDRSSSGWFAASPCRATAEDHRTQRPSPPISDAAPHQSLDLLHRPPNCVRGTPCPAAFSQKAPVPGHPTVRPGPDSNSPSTIFMPRIRAVVRREARQLARCCFARRQTRPDGALARRPGDETRLRRAHSSPPSGKGEVSRGHSPNLRAGARIAFG
jgi:hypothetical protein